eukprot:1722403-Pyramimonas_sp.AAC.1
METTIGDINLLQEHRLQGRLFQFQVSRLQRSGWKVHGCPGVQLESGFVSGGTFVVAKNHLDTWNPPGVSVVIYPGRVARCFFRSARLGVLVVYSVYLKDSEGLSVVNTEVLTAIWTDCFKHNLPFIIGGDFNMEPHILYNH